MTKSQLHPLAYAQQHCGHDHTPEPSPCTNHSLPAHSHGLHRLHRLPAWKIKAKPGPSDCRAPGVDAPAVGRNPPGLSLRLSLRLHRLSLRLRGLHRLHRLRHDLREKEKKEREREL